MDVREEVGNGQIETCRHEISINNLNYEFLVRRQILTSVILLLTPYLCLAAHLFKCKYGGVVD